jgi:hypothetical protein
MIAAPEILCELPAIAFNIDPEIVRRFGPPRASCSSTTSEVAEQETAPTRRCAPAGALAFGMARASWRRQLRDTRRRWRRRTRQRYEETRDIDFTLTDRQSDVFASDTRYRVLIAGRRFGKTYLACVELIAHALEREGSLNWYVAPFYSMAKDIAWETLKALIPAAWLIGKPNESTLTVRFKNGSRIQLKGAEFPNRLRGRTLYFVVFDEFPMAKRAAWDESISPSQSTTLGGALFIGTPMGFNWGYDYYLRGEDATYPDWQAWQFTTADGGLVSLQEIEDQKRQQSARVYRQEYLASFETLTGRVYDNFARKDHVDADADDPGGDVPVLIGMDFNVNPMTAVLAYEHVDNAGKVWCHVFDVIEIMASNTEEMADEINDRFPRQVPDRLRPGKTKRGRKVIVCPDPAGNARSTKAPVGQTDYTILERHGFLIDAPEAHALVKDRVNNTQALLRDASGATHVRVHPRCKQLIKGWEGLTYKEGTNQPDKTLGLDHVCDAYDYLAWRRFNLLQRYRAGYGIHRV